ncbi:MAG: hypothetical protein IMW89_05285 [Ktedonobacteraceae bacterium]|nr:hypothetical protein [Ktedonobacteraceae bacterium]
MLWNLVVKILTGVLVDLLVALLTKLVVSACSALAARYRASQQVSFA